MRGEISDDIGSVTTPKRGETLLIICPGETVSDTLIRGCQSALLDPGEILVSVSSITDVSTHFILILNQKLDPFNGSSSGFGDSSRHASHQEVGHECLEVFGCLNNLRHDAESARSKQTSPKIAKRVTNSALVIRATSRAKEGGEANVSDSYRAI